MRYRHTLDLYTLYFSIIGLVITMSFKITRTKHQICANRRRGLDLIGVMKRLSLLVALDIFSPITSKNGELAEMLLAIYALDISMKRAHEIETNNAYLLKILTNILLSFFTVLLAFSLLKK